MTYSELVTFMTTSFGYQSLASALGTYIQFGVDLLDQLYNESQGHGNKIHPVEVSANQKIVVVPIQKIEKVLLYAQSVDGVVYEGVEIKYSPTQQIRNWILDDYMLVSSSYTIPAYWTDVALLLRDSMADLELLDYQNAYTYGEDYIVFADDVNYARGAKGLLLYPAPSSAVTLHVHGRYKSGTIADDANEWILMHGSLVAFATKYFVEAMYFNDNRRAMETLVTVNGMLDAITVKQITLVKGPKKIGG